MKYGNKPNVKRQVQKHPDAVTNYEGGLSFAVDPRTELYLKAASCLVGENKFYESAEFADTELIRSIHHVLENDPEFVLQLAVYLREQMHLRSVPLMLCAEYANVAPGTVPHARDYIQRCIARADELTEILAYQFTRNEYAPRSSKVPMVLKSAIADAFPKFSTYQLGKYNRKSEVTLKDVLRLVHPKPQTKQQSADWKAIGNGTLASPVTWETQRSAGRMNWHQIIHEVFHKDNRVNNYMAQLRNLRNMLNSPDVTTDDIDLVCSMIADEEAVLNSKQFPFRFLSAYKSISDLERPGVNATLDALEVAAMHSAGNIPKLPGNTLIACDVSGSMTWEPVSTRSSVMPYDIGTMLGSIAHRFCDRSITGIFGSIWRQIPMAKMSGILSNVTEMRRHRGEVGMSTNGHKIIEYLIEENIEVDRIMIFTDCQMWNGHFHASFASEFVKYQRMHPRARLYSFDLTGYGTVMFPPNNSHVAAIGGWSDRIFDFIPMFESSGETVINRIKAIRP